MSDELAFDELAGISESLRRADIAAHKATLSGDALATAVSSADRAHFSRVVAAGIACDINTPNTRGALQFDPAPAEEYSLTDDFTFLLIGGKYSVSVAATFAEGGSVALKDVGDVTLSNFTEAGIAIVDLKYGVFRFVLSNATDLVASVTNAPYF